MAVAALIISVLSLAMSGAAVYYTRRQAALEEDRRHDERKPDLDWSSVGAVGQDLSVDLVNRGPSEPDRIEISFPGGSQTYLPAAGFAAGGGPTTLLVLGGLKVGQSHRFRIVPQGPDASGTFRVAVTAWDRDRPWHYTFDAMFDAGPNLR